MIRFPARLPQRHSQSSGAPRLLPRTAPPLAWRALAAIVLALAAMAPVPALAQALLEPIPNSADFSSVTLVPLVPTPVGVNVRERNGVAATLTSARADFYAAPLPPGHLSAVPLRSITLPFHASIPRLQSA